VYIRFTYSLYVLYLAHISCRWNEYTPFTLFLVIQVANRVFSLTTLNVVYVHVYVCSTWSIFELKTRFETWITRNDIKGVSLFNLFYFITNMAYLCSQRTPNVQIKYFVLNRGWKPHSFQVMIFVYVCSI
jgi:hypothetical protein